MIDKNTTSWKLRVFWLFNKEAIIIGLCAILILFFCATNCNFNNPSYSEDDSDWGDGPTPR